MQREKLEQIKRVLMLGLDLHGELTGNIFETIVVMLSEAIMDLRDIGESSAEKISSKEVFSLALKKAGNELSQNATYASIRTIWEEKEPYIIYKLNQSYHDAMTLEECRNLIETTFLEREAFVHRDYTVQDYQKVSSLFKHYLIDSISSNPALASKLCVNSVIDIGERIEQICFRLDQIQATPKSLQIISKETRRHKNSFHRESRDKELHQIQSLLIENDKICVVSGIGGIGKTELCKYLFHWYMSGHTPDGTLYIGWITYHGSLIQTLYDQILCPKDSNNVMKGYLETCAYLQSLGKELLLFVDNIEKTVANDSEISFLWNLNCRMVVTSRINSFDTVSPILIGPLSIRWSTCLFYTFYHGKKDKASLNRIFKATSRHPLALELIAKTAQAAGQSIEQVADQLESFGFCLPDCQKKIWYENDQKELIDHFCKLFKMVDLPATYVKILSRLSLLPSKSYHIDQLIEWNIVSDREKIELLHLRGWISFEDNLISVHPVISDAIHHKVSHNYKIYQSMYHALANTLEYTTTSFFPEKYFLAVDFFYVIQRLRFIKLEYAQLLNQIATVFNRSGQFECSYKLQKEAINIKEKLHAANDSLFSSYNNISLSCKNLARKSKNDKMLLEALKWAEEAQHLGKELYLWNPTEYALKYAITMNNLGLCQFNLGLLAEAEQSLLNSIDLKIEARGVDCIELGQSYNNLALVYKRRSIEEHDPVQMELALEKQLLAVKNKTDMDYPIHLFNLASIEYLMSNYSDAKIHLEEVIQIWSKNEEVYKDKIKMATECHQKVCVALHEQSSLD